MEPSLEEQLYWERQLESQGLPAEPESELDILYIDHHVFTEFFVKDTIEKEDYQTDSFPFDTIFPEYLLVDLIDKFAPSIYIEMFNEKFFEKLCDDFRDIPKKVKHFTTIDRFNRTYGEHMKFLENVPISLVVKSIQSEAIIDLAKKTKEYHYKIYAPLI